ncbi:MAG: 30S ribosomal protein S19e [Candidatus Hadarchaeum sp.]|uniref:30S ribosomal protein S19e n=2 Tax=Candidatus Hadarchaeum sp. TaxID=2883567 RepID=UPI00317BA441
MEMSVREVQPTALVKRLSEELKKIEAIKPPQWSIFVKTGVHKERPPEQADWWYTRAASLLRRLYVDGPVGVSRLRTYYGGRQNRGQPPEHFRKAGGKIIRVALQQLEKAGLVTKAERKGRKLTSKGVSMVESLAQQLKNEMKA